ncbi:MAG TPA: DUF927 domain-containing protein [Gemmataceae bacterium]
MLVRPTRDGDVTVPLATWTARIVEQTTLDDGAERRTVLTVAGKLADGTPLPRAEVPAREYPWMNWPVEVWGTRAVVYAGSGTADHVRAAVQILSGDVPTRTVFSHAGWREIDGYWCYLHAGGGIGADGPVAGVLIQLPEALANYVLPAPPEDAVLAAAIRASLAVLDMAPDSITAALLGAVYRAVLGSADYALHLAGPTGAGKSELSALGQQHWGAGMDRLHLPASWSSTGNSLEGIAFAAKDALLTVDDFAPGGSNVDVARLHREADRLLRAQGNRSGRQRMRADGSLRPARPPRGTILSTGEDIPRGQSLRARVLVLELEPGDLDWSRLTACQRDAAAGLYAQALAGFVRWLAPRYPTIRAGLAAETAALRERVHSEGLHARTPGVIADLATGWHYWLDYALESRAIDATERDTLARRAWAALLEAAARQAEHIESAEPCGHFLRLLAGSLASGRGHVADVAGQEPENSQAWGWRNITIGAGQNMRVEWQPQGRLIGWVEGDDLYLEPEASFAEAQELARHQGDSLPVSSRTLWRRLHERSLLASCDDRRQRYTVRRTLGGVRRYVIHLRANSISSCSGPAQPAQNGGEAQNEAEKWAGPWAGPQNRPTDRPTKSAQNPQDSREQGGFGPVGPVQNRTDTIEDGKHDAWYAPGCEGMRTPVDEDK